MANWKLQVATPWIAIGDNPPAEGEDSNRPQIAEEYTFIKWSDITGQPSENIRPSPNLYIIEMEVIEAVKDDILLDGDYLVYTYVEIEDGIT